MRQYGLPHGWPYQPSTICGPETPRPAITRWPPASASTVPAAIAAVAGGRAASCMMPVPRRIRFVSAARYASGVIASEPYASAVHTESKPSRSASRTVSTGNRSSAPEYPMLSPSFMTWPPERGESFHQHAAVDVEALAVDEAGGVGEQEQDSAGDLLRPAEASQGDAAGDHRALLRRERRVHRRVAGPRIDAVDAHPRADQRTGEALGHGDDGALAGGVRDVGDPAAAELVAVGADRHDPPLAARQHAPQRRLDGEERPPGVDREYAVPLLGGH